MTGLRKLIRMDGKTDRTPLYNRNAFFAHATTILETSPRGKNYLDVVESFITTSLTSTSTSLTSASSTASASAPTSASVNPTPLSLIQIGRQPPTSSTNILFSTQEIECWVRDTEVNEAGKAQEQEKRTRNKVEEEAKQENGKKRRRIKEAKKRDLLELLGGM
jgi:hypothetical protein